MFSYVLIWLVRTSFPLFRLLVSALISHTCVSLAVPPFRTQAAAFFYLVSQLSLLTLYPALVLPHRFHVEACKRSLQTVSFLRQMHCHLLFTLPVEASWRSFPWPSWLLIPLYIRIFFLALGFPWIWSANTLTVYTCVGFTLVLLDFEDDTDCISINFCSLIIIRFFRNRFYWFSRTRMSQYPGFENLFPGEPTKTGYCSMYTP